MPLLRILGRIIFPIAFESKHKRKFRSSESQIFFSSITLFGVIVHGCYAYGTNKSETILVEDKYTFTEKGFSQFCISAQNKSKKEQYLIPHSIWYWQFDVNEKYQSMEKNKFYNITYYGYRIPFLGIYPNIVDIKNES